MNVYDTSVNEIKPDYNIGLFLNTNIQDNLLKYLPTTYDPMDSKSKI
jgi:hypothetical protein